MKKNLPSTKQNTRTKKKNPTIQVGLPLLCNVGGFSTHALKKEKCS
jgi:hypothetical protein